MNKQKRCLRETKIFILIYIIISIIIFGGYKLIGYLESATRTSSSRN